MKKLIVAVALLAALPALGRYSMDQLYDQTSAAAGSLDTGILTVERCDALLVVMEAAGAAAPTGCAIRGVRNAPAGVTPAEYVIATCNPGIGAVSLACTLHPALAVGPPPRRVRVLGTGGAASTVRITVSCEVR